MTAKKDIPSPNPSGLCMCGCGVPTPLARVRSPQRGLLKGEPVRYLRGHAPRTFDRPPPPNPSGFCQCGCGGRTKRAVNTQKAIQRVFGEYQRYIQGHGAWKPGSHIYECMEKGKPRNVVRGRDGSVQYFARVVMEGHLRRHLRPGEVVHHINGITNDDRIANLMLFANNGDHIRYEYSTGQRQNPNPYARKKAS